ncbi:MAG: hypothetical protein K2I42_00625, partial [Anaeroplasmataceae bacterium]|nr:hypothetical protein [Anaeroplasmataceae bacterium]
IKGAPFDPNSILVRYLKSDGTYEVIKTATASKKSYFNATTEATNTNSSFSVNVEIVDTDFKPENKTTTLTITPVDKLSIMLYALYGAGGLADASYKNDFIILYNPTEHDVDLNGWSVQYASPTSASAVSLTNIVLLEGTIKAYQYYKILAKSDGVNGADLPFSSHPDLTCELALGQANAKIFLSTTTTAINAGDFVNSSCVDVLGTGTATGVEGTAAPAISKTTFAKRHSFKDTNDNSVDFEIVDFANPNPWEFLEESITYNYAKTILDNSTLDFDNLPDTFTLPASFNGTEIIWNWQSDVENILINGGEITINRNLNGKGDLVGYILGEERFRYNIIISNKTILSAPANVKLNHLTLEWDVVEHATFYEIYVNGAIYATSYSASYVFDPSTDLFKERFGLNQRYDIQVKSIPADKEMYEESKLSSNVIVNYLDTSDLSKIKVGNELIVKGVVTIKASNNNEFYLVDANSGQGLAVFRKTTDTVTFDSISAGQVIYVTGSYTLFNELPELEKIQGITIVNEVIDLDPITDIRQLNMNDIGHLIDFSNASSQAIVTDISSGNISVLIGGVNYQLRGESKYLDDTSIVTLNNLVKTNKLKFKGVISKYYSNYQIYVTEVIDVDSSVEDSYKLEIALEDALNEISISGKEGDSKQLLTLKEYYGAEVSFSYLSSNPSVLSIDVAGQLAFAKVEVETEVVITVTARLGMNELRGTKAVTVKVPSAGGEEVISYTYTFTSKAISSIDTPTALGDETWTVAGDGNYFGYSSDKGEQFGSGSKPYKTLTLSSGGTHNKVTKIVIEASTASGASATMNCTVGETLGVPQALTTTSTAYTFEFSEVTGNIIISVDQTTSKAIYIKSITIYTMQ